MEKILSSFITWDQGAYVKVVFQKGLYLQRLTGIAIYSYRNNKTSPFAPSEMNEKEEQGNLSGTPSMCLLTLDLGKHSLP